MKRILLSVILFSIIYGDVMYEIEIKTEGMIRFGNEVITARNFIKHDRMRTEIKTANGRTDVVITRLDKGVIWILDGARKEFIEVLISEFLYSREESERGIFDTSSFSSIISVEKLEETKEILKMKCKKYFVSANMNTENEKITITKTLWIGRDFPGYSEIKEINTRLQGLLSGIGLLEIDNELHRNLQKKLSEIDGFPLEIEINVKTESDGVNFELKGSSVTKKISTAPISDKVFEIPQGYNLAKTVEAD